AALDAFPVSLWAQVAARRLRRASAQLLAGGDALGYRPLRHAVAEYLNTSRGVKCSADQVLIISGVQEALERAAHLLLDRDDRVWLEEPGYPGAAIVFWAVGGKICPVPVDAEGLDVERGEERWPGPKLIYTTPAHQFPLGMTMSLRRRLALLDSARRSHSLIFEDDYDSEYRYSGRPVPALQGLDRTGSVIYALLRRADIHDDDVRVDAGGDGRDARCPARARIGSDLQLRREVLSQAVFQGRPPGRRDHDRSAQGPEEAHRDHAVAAEDRTSEASAARPRDPERRLVAPEYAFLTRWRVRATAKEVASVLGAAPSL